MDIALLKHKKSEIINKYGLWTGHKIHLGDDFYTIDREEELTNKNQSHTAGIPFDSQRDGIRLKRIMQMISDIAGEPIENLRILDIACMEGLFAIEPALHGAKVVAIEGREANIEKARFSGNILSLDNLEFIQDNVLNLSKEKYGCFDVVLCLGLLYHLDAPEVFSFVEKMAEVCQRFLIIDTQTSIGGTEKHIYKGKQYWGSSVLEPSSTTEKRDNQPWSSIVNELWSSMGNAKSFFLTRPSLCNLLSHVGFTSVYECYNPRQLGMTNDRITLLAIKGKRQNLISSPSTNELPEEDWPEESQIGKYSLQSNPSILSRLIPNPIKRLLPNQLKEAIKTFLKYSGLRQKLS